MGSLSVFLLFHFFASGRRAHVASSSGLLQLHFLSVRNPLPANMSDERTFIMIKPDGVQRGLVGEIIKRFEQKGFQLVAMKFMQADEELLKQHYADLSSKPFFPGLIKYMASGPVVKT